MILRSGLNSHWFPMVGMVINPIVGVNIPLKRIPVIKSGMTNPQYQELLDLGTYGNWMVGASFNHGPQPKSTFLPPQKNGANLKPIRSLKFPRVFSPASALGCPTSHQRQRHRMAPLFLPIPYGSGPSRGDPKVSSGDRNPQLVTFY